MFLMRSRSAPRMAEGLRCLPGSRSEFLAEDHAGVVMLRFDEGDQPFGLVAVIRPAGLLQLLGEGGA